MSIEYWLGIRECNCDSLLPIGSCLHCDLEQMLEFTDAVARLVKEVDQLHMECLTAEVRELLPKIRHEDPLVTT